jgi:hypothetical protein
LKSLGIDWAEQLTFPTLIADAGEELTFGDISLTLLDIGPAESDHDSVWVLRAGDAEIDRSGNHDASDSHVCVDRATRQAECVHRRG